MSDVMSNAEPSTFGRGGPWLPALLLVAATLVVFGPVVGHRFLSWDDQQHVVANPHFSPVSWQGLGKIWTEPYWGLYVPLSYTFFAGEALMAQRPLPGGAGYALNPTVFHLGNLLLHVGCVLLVFVVLRRLFRHDGPACAAALLFALHPVQVESVAWISETRGVLCALFSLLAVWLYLRGTDTPVLRVSTALYYFAATAALLAAMLSKPAAVAVPLLVVVIEIGLLRRPVRRVLAAMAPWLIVAVCWTVLTKLQQPDRSVWYVPPLWVRPLVAGDALAFYAYKLFAPLQFGPDYGRTPARVLQQGWCYVAWLLPVVLVVALALVRGRRLWLTAAGVSVAWLLPVLGLIPFDFQRISTVSDRYMYLAMLGPAIALAGYLAVRWNRWTIAVTVSVLCLLGVRSFAQTLYWHDDATLYPHALRINPGSVVVNNNYGLLLAERGRFVEAAHCFLKALEVDPNRGESHLGLGACLLELGDLDQAERYLREARRLHPDWSLVYCHLARVLRAQGRYDEAIDACREALRLAADDPKLAQTLQRTLERYLREKQEAQRAKEQEPAASSAL